jgi:hypothetical protein
MKPLFSGMLFFLFTAPVFADEISSAYTDLVAERDCKTVEKAEEGEGDWARMVCTGYAGLPVHLNYDDARESLYYGFAPDDGRGLAWESFSAFNSAGPKVEWRLAAEDGKPFATIHRWFVSDPDNPDKKVEVLVVSKVAAEKGSVGCTVGLVRASGRPDANAAARRIADDAARSFTCGKDAPVKEGSVPEFLRQE